VEEEGEREDKERDLAIGALPTEEEERPRPEWVRGRCPECGDDLVSNLYYIGGQGYVIYWECWSSFPLTHTAPKCKFRKKM